MGHKYFDKQNTNFSKKTESDISKRFFVPNVQIGTNRIFGEEHNHLANVMRMRAGEEVILICNDDFDYFAKILEVKRDETIVNVFKKEQNMANPNAKCTAFVAMNKREPFSLIVRMLSELGVANFVPIITKYTLPQDTTDKIERYQKIADQSAKQCRRSKTMKVELPQKLTDACKSFSNFDKVFFAYECEKQNTLSCQQNLQNFAFLIGPVAGFDDAEAQLITESGAEPITLGKRILKADTACVCMASILMNMFDK